MDYTKYLGFKDPNKDQAILKDGGGRFLTQALFLETYRHELSYKPIYTLNHVDKKTHLPSARLIYINSTDEYDAALKLVGNIDHWIRLTGKNKEGNYQCNWFMHGNEYFEGVLRWREDMALRDDSFAKMILREQAVLGNVSAAKALLEHNKGKSGAGRPSNKSLPATDDKRTHTMERMRKLGLTVNDSK